MKKLIIPALAMLVLLSGCLHVLNPLFKENQVVFEKTVLGKWKEGYGDKTWEISKLADKNLYFVRNVNVTRQEDSLNNKTYRVDTSYFYAQLGKIGNQLYLDMIRALDFTAKESSSIFWAYEISPHLIAKVDIKDNISISFVRDTWLQEQLDSKHFKLSNVNYIPGFRRSDRVGKYEMAITATTEELQAFLVKNKNNPNLFSDPYVLTKMK